MQSKNTMRSQWLSTEIGKEKKRKSSKFWEGYGLDQLEIKIISTAGRSTIWISTLKFCSVVTTEFNIFLYHDPAILFLDKYPGLNIGQHV